MTEYSMQLISPLDPLRYLFELLVLTSKLMRWIILLTEFDILYVTQKSIKGCLSRSLGITSGYRQYSD